MKLPRLDEGPVLIALGGPNGAGKTTFFEAHLADAGLRFVNADILAQALAITPYEAAAVADNLRRSLVAQRESFVMETVFSDPVGDKIAFLRGAGSSGYTVILCFIGISGPDVSQQRVAMRLSQGGHDVPDEKLESRYPRTLANLAHALRELPQVLVFDNSDLARPFRFLAQTESGQPVACTKPLPAWFRAVWQSAFPASSC